MPGMNVYKIADLSTIWAGIEVCRKPPSQTWRTFLGNHLKSLVSVDFFTVQTIRFQILYVFLVSRL